MRHAFRSPAVKSVFDSWPAGERGALLALRDLVFDAAEGIGGTDALTETLKWGQPAWHPTAPRTGTTVRIDRLAGTDRGYALYFSCQTTLAATYRALYGDVLDCEGNRALVFGPAAPVPAREVQHCIALALTYHRRHGRG